MLTFLLCLQVAAPAPIVVSSDPVILLDNYADPAQPDCAGAPAGSLCPETQTAIYYPDGRGPLDLGYAPDLRPVLVALRGADKNAPLFDQLPWFQTNVLPRDWIGVDPNYPQVCKADVDLGHGEPLPPECASSGLDYEESVSGAALLIQYLRANSAQLNVDPDQIYVFGRSFGGVVAYALALKEDWSDPASQDPVLQASSRPNGIVAFSSVAALDCSVQFTKFNELLKAFFPVSSQPGATLQEKLDDSAWYWLANPQLYGRTTTPPMLLGYNLAYTQGCGASEDPHDGIHGVVMKQKLDAFADATDDAHLGASSVLFHALGFYALDPATMAVVMDWAEACYEDTHPKLFLYPVGGLVANELKTKEFRVVGGDDGSGVWFFLGFTLGSIPIPWCSGMTGDLLDFYYMGAKAFTVVPPTSGRASLFITIPAGLAGVQFKLQAMDFLACKKTNVLTTWISTVPAGP